MSDAPFFLRPFRETDLEQDSQLLHTLSNYQVPQDPEGNRIWQQNRLNYDETAGLRRHYIALYRPTREPIAYAAIEQQGPDPTGFRLYLVFDPRQWSFEDLGEFLYQQLLHDAGELGARTVALVEYASDLGFLEFLRQRGFAEVGRGTFNGFEIVRMENRLQRG